MMIYNIYMKIINNLQGERILLKDNNVEVNISDCAFIQYRGIYYKQINDIIQIVEIETPFMGIVVGERSRFDRGIMGIYIKPMYIWDIMNNEWKMIVNYVPPVKKYFFYPHLLLLPGNYHNHSIYNLETCDNREPGDFIGITKEFDLGAPL
jgi:hypothetical protein